MEILLYAFWAVIVVWGIIFVIICCGKLGSSSPRPPDYVRARAIADDILGLCEYEEVEVLGPSGQLHIVYPIRSCLQGYITWARIYIVSLDRPVKILIEGSVFMEKEDEIFIQQLLEEFRRQGTNVTFTSPAPIPEREEIVNPVLLSKIRLQRPFVVRNI